MENKNNATPYERLREVYDKDTLDEIIRVELERVRESEYNKLRVVKHMNEGIKKDNKYIAKIKNIGIIIGDIIDLMTYKPIYVKKAVGKGGQEIDVYKFRTMVRNADKYLPQILNDNNINHQGKFIDDPRITKLGAWMRKYHIDELPQLYNVLISRNMKWVGIRPMEKEIWKNYPRDIFREAIKDDPGMFGANYYARAEEGIPHEQVLRTYQKEHKIYPDRTDKKYLRKILYNKIIKGEHSS